MINERTLSIEESATAAAIQSAIDELGPGGGRIVLPEMDLTLDRGIELRSGVELVGQGKNTILRKGPGRVYPLSGYHNYGMCDVPLQSTAGLAVGMTVSVYDNVRRGFYETFARITWIDGNWVGLDHGIEADYQGHEEPQLTTAYPMIFGHGIANAAVRDLTLEGQREDQESLMGGCRGAAVYLARCRDIEVSRVQERNYHGEGLGFQMCRDIQATDCRFSENEGNGMHPGAGSTNCLVERCVGSGNVKSGFYFCVRANRITVRDCTLEGNGNGVSIGTRDCHNLLEACRIAGNRGPGLLVRETHPPIEVHSCVMRGCQIEGNATKEDQGQVVILGEAHDLVFENNRLVGNPGRSLPGMSMVPTVTNVCCRDNEITGCRPPIQAEDASLIPDCSVTECGYGTYDEKIFRHLGFEA